MHGAQQMTVQLQHEPQTFRRIDVVINDQYLMLSTYRTSIYYTLLLDGSGYRLQGQLDNKFTPKSGPGLFTRALPPCSSTRLFTTVSLFLDLPARGPPRVRLG
jgi:hypothetical protein